MAKHNARGVILDSAQGDKSAPFRFATAARRNESLRVEIDGGLSFLQENALAAPVGEVRRRPRIRIVAVVVPGFGSAQNDPDQVVGIYFIVMGLSCRSNLVIGLCDDVRNRDPRGIIAQRPEWSDGRHWPELNCTRPASSHPAKP